MSNDLGQLVLFPFSQVLPMKLKREWTVAISKPTEKGFVGNGAQRSSSQLISQSSANNAYIVFCALRISGTLSVNEV